MLRALALAILAAACGSPPAPAAPPAPPREPIALTYLGVAGWQLDAGGNTFLTDPYFSRPDLDAPLVPDAAAIAARAPARAVLVMVGHSHADHLLDAPAVAQRTGAEIMGSISTARVARASGVPDDRIITIQGGEDYAFDGDAGDAGDDGQPAPRRSAYSVRVMRSLHSALGDKHVAGGGEIPATITMPLRFADYAEGGAYAYLVRAGGHQVFFLSTANFIEHELDGIRPDVAIIATGLRQEIHDYTCRLMRALGHPPLVYTNHFDDWRGPPVPAPPDADLRAFVDEVAGCSPRTKVVIPRHFERMEVR